MMSSGLRPLRLPPNKRLKLTGGDRSSGSGVLCPGMTRSSSRSLVRRASRPQLKRDPLGTHELSIMGETWGLIVAGVGFASHHVLRLRSLRYRIPESHPRVLEVWTRTVDPMNYSVEGRRLIPSLWATAALFAIGVIILVASA